jgi:hypothetical protein
VNGDVAVTPSIYNPALQETAVVWGQIQEEGAEAVISHGFH